MTADGACFAWNPAILDYNFGAQHPLDPMRLRAFLDLLEDAGLLAPDDPRRLTTTLATRDELELVHRPAYVDAVQKLSEGPPYDEALAELYGFGSDDNPAFEGMHQAAAAIVGASLAAARAVAEGACGHAFSPGGGLHHALPERASGFCIYNDIAVAIADLVHRREWKVLYVDFDAHHGDGVQAAFYDDPRVLTFSIHETGRHLFPGTGFLREMGVGAGLGYAVNMPVSAFTTDDSWVEAVEAILPGLAARFQPDIIVSQHGCDGHAWDPLSHLRLTTSAFARAAQLVHELAHDYCDGRWLALGGGGYDVLGVVPRAWTLVWAEVAHQPRPETVPEPWRDRWQVFATDPLPARFLDDPAEVVPPIPRDPEIVDENRGKVAMVREFAFPGLLRTAFPWPGQDRPRWPEQRPAAQSRTERVDTAKGPAFLRDLAPPSLVARLDIDPGMRAFMRRPDREHKLLINIAGLPDTNLTIAHTPEGVIVGHVSMTEAEGRWAPVPRLYEVAIEIAAGWRRTHLASHLLRFVTSADYVEDYILVALGYTWHWDLDGSGLNAFQYRTMLSRLFAKYGFDVQPTDDPEIMGSETNVLLARVGSRVPYDVYETFHNRLFRRAAWAF